MIKKNIFFLVFLFTLLISPSSWAIWPGYFLLGITGGYGIRDQGGLDLAMGHPMNAAGIRPVTTFTTSLFTEGGSIWGIMGGYSWQCGRYLLGTELNMEWEDINQPEYFDYLDVLGNYWVAYARYKPGIIFELTGRLRYEVSCFFMPYFRMGVQTSRDELVFDAGTVPTFLTVNLFQKSRSYRFVAGIGVEYPLLFIIPNATFRIEYNYHSRGNGVDVRDFASDDLTFFKVASKPRIQSGMASIVWNFI